MSSQDFGHADVAVERLLHFFADHREKVCLLHHAAAEDDALRAEREDEVGARQPQVVGFQRPRGMVGR